MKNYLRQMTSNLVDCENARCISSSSSYLERAELEMKVSASGKRKARPPISNLKEDAKKAFYRKRNAMYSRRKYMRKKIEIEVLHQQKNDLVNQNHELRLEQKRLEKLISAGNQIVKNLDSTGTMLHQQGSGVSGVETFGRPLGNLSQGGFQATVPSGIGAMAAPLRHTPSQQGTPTFFDQGFQRLMLGEQFNDQALSRMEPADFLLLKHAIQGQNGAAAPSYTRGVERILQNVPQQTLSFFPLQDLSSSTEQPLRFPEDKYRPDFASPLPASWALLQNFAALLSSQGGQHAGVAFLPSSR